MRAACAPNTRFNYLYPTPPYTTKAKVTIYYRRTTSLPFSPTSIEFDKALDDPHIVRVNCLIGLGEPVRRKRSIRAVLSTCTGQYLLSLDLQCLPIYIFAIICYRFKDLGLISESLVVVVTVFSSAFGSVGQGPALAAHCL